MAETIVGADVSNTQLTTLSNMDMGGGSDRVSPHRDEVFAKTPVWLNFIADTDLNLQYRDLALSQILNLAIFI